MQILFSAINELFLLGISFYCFILHLVCLGLGHWFMLVNSDTNKKHLFLCLLFSSSELLDNHGAFTWLGQTQYKLQLKNQEASSLQLKACFIHTGVYNLGTPRVFAKLSGQVTLFETSQQNSMPALIIINNVGLDAGLL